MLVAAPPAGTSAWCGLGSSRGPSSSLLASSSLVAARSAGSWGKGAGDALGKGQHDSCYLAMVDRGTLGKWEKLSKITS